MMGRRNWMPLYIPDFLADTTHLSAAETGAYLCLIMDYWLHDGLPDDDRKLAGIARLPLKAWQQIRSTIQAFFHDGWRHKRIDAELEKMIGTHGRRVAAGSKGGTIASINRSNATSRASSKRVANEQQTSSRAGSKTVAGLQHFTQESKITSTSSEAARAEEILTKSTAESAEPLVGLRETAREELRKSKSIPVTGELQASIQAKRWAP